MRAGTARRVVARAPGRVNLIGDHTDYCGGQALPMAIDLGTEVTFVPDGSDRLVVRSGIDPHPATVALGWLRRGTGAPAPGGATPGWWRLVEEIARRVGAVPGGDAEVRSAVPVGAGLSSSAAFSVSLALALGAPADPRRLATLCRDAEAAAGSDVGLLDPLAIAAARRGHALLIDFATLDVAHVAVPEHVEVVIVHSGARRRVGESPYGARRAECAAAARRIGVPLGVASDGDLVALPGTLRHRARHVVSECRRVREVAAAFEAGDATSAGSAMTESHRSLAGDFEASVPAVDALVAALCRHPGVYGARMTGAGFGGCVVALARPGAVDPAGWPGRAWVVHPSGGATRWEERGVATRPARDGGGATRWEATGATASEAT